MCPKDALLAKTMISIYNAMGITVYIWVKKFNHTLEIDIQRNFSQINWVSEGWFSRVRV